MGRDKDELAIDDVNMHCASVTERHIERVLGDNHGLAATAPSVVQCDPIINDPSSSYLPPVVIPRVYVVLNSIKLGAIRTAR